MPERPFCDLCFDDHVPDNDLLRRIDRLLDLSDARQNLRLSYCSTGHPSIDPEPMIRKLQSVSSKRASAFNIALSLFSIRQASQE